jgi:ABC-type transporter Mla MlaB component
MLRISTSESEGNVVTLRLEGQIVGAWISELDKACEQMLAAGHKVILDLGAVSLIDRRGLTLLASLSRQAVALVRCSPFQKEQLRLASLPQSDKTLQSR